MKLTHLQLFSSEPVYMGQIIEESGACIPMVKLKQCHVFRECLLNTKQATFGNKNFDSHQTETRGL